jgi:hypothetical protein
LNQRPQSAASISTEGDPLGSSPLANTPRKIMNTDHRLRKLMLDALDRDPAIARRTGADEALDHPSADAIVAKARQFFRAAGRRHA